MIDSLILCGFAFLAGLVDAIAGGGGLIQVPALMVFLPTTAVSLILGTNKLSSCAGTAFAAFRYARSVPVNWRVVLPAAAAASICAIGGAWMAVRLDASVLKPIVVGLLIVVAVQTFFQKRLGSPSGERSSGPEPVRGMVWLAMIIGFYDGFLGPGAGSFLMFGLVRYFGYDFLQAAATTKVLNFATNFGALALFAATGNVLYGIGLAMAVLNMAGGYFGAQLAIQGGNRLIRFFFMVIVGILILSIVRDLIG
ncbi:MAG: sulfite exporter TauE/SafE family protein [Burkholderiales bacterium]